MKYTQEELNEILRMHKKWLTACDGQRANLHYANLRGLDLKNSNLRGADLQGADLQGADLQGAYLRCANLLYADLQGANLQGADLQGADLQGANLLGAYLKGANIQFPIACPTDGEFIAWKNLLYGEIAKIKILEDSKRLSATTNKCRCDKALVLAIYKNGKEVSEGYSSYDSSFKYEVGKIVSVNNFCEDRWDECSSGIHFFIDRTVAENY